MMKALGIFFFILAHVVFSQTRNIVLIVDTIKGNDAFKPSVNFGGFAYLNNDIEAISYSKKTFPNFISTKFEIHDTSTIFIPLNSWGSQLRVKGLKSISNDTLRIDKIEMIEDKLTDTTFLIKYWYAERHDSLIPIPKKTEKKIILSKGRPILKSHSVNLVINKKPYSSLLFVTKGDVTVSHGSGTDPRNPYKKNGERKKNVLRFSIDSETKHWVYLAVITL